MSAPGTVDGTMRDTPQSRLRSSPVSLKAVTHSRSLRRFL